MTCSKLEGKENERLAGELGYLDLSHAVDAITEELRKALRARNPRWQAELRLERAWHEMQLRDLWGPWSPQGERWQAWMWDDIHAAQRLADCLAVEVGDSTLPSRLLIDYPAVQRLVAS